ncbi:MarR family transcriptional regulator [Kitasatospora sp. RB6PN24]|uniref:MarR family winged helix-turn-helix transcriptional regulator n=1 Tax=Kitasatospora humi TaxID=2893891 RepID=UPI001E4E23BB|nr:MarR family transcriptional regulator [Kitasatospora humi]MCC9312182.1 MarR family transcriptional regulator [Kitasatospora humi]
MSSSSTDSRRPGTADTAEPADTADTTDAPAHAGAIESADSAGPPGTAESTTGSVEVTGGVEPAGSVEVTGGIEPAGGVEPAGSAERASSAEAAGDTEAADIAELADELNRAMKRIRHRTVHRLEPYGLTPGQGRALRVLERADRCEAPGRAIRLSELADRLNIAPRSATTVVDALEQAGLVERVPDPADRRAVGLVLTVAGRAAVERLAQVRQEVAQEYFSAADPAEVAVMLTVLRRAEAAYVRTARRPAASG